MAKRKKGTGPGGGEPGADRGGSPEPGPVRGDVRKGARRRGDAGRRYSPEERRRLLEACAKSQMTVRDFCKTMGMSDATLCKWRRRYEAEGAKGLEPRKRGRPKGSGTGSKLPEPVQAAIVETKKLFPDFGLRKLRDYVGRFLHLRVTTGGVRGVLKDAALPSEVPKPKRRRWRRSAEPRRFERDLPGQLWQSDITSYLLPRHHSRVYLTVFLDDCSRYVVAWNLQLHQRQELVSECLLEGIGRFGKPREVLTDQGPQYYAWHGKSAFDRLLEREGIAHAVARTHHPQTVGKCERLWKTVGEELIDRAHPQSVEEVRERMGHYFAHYNHFRPHQGIGGMTPADRFFGAESLVRREVEAGMAANELALALGETPRPRDFLLGQMGDRKWAVSGEKVRVYLEGKDGRREDVGTKAPGQSGGKDGSDDHDSDEHEGARDGVGADGEEDEAVQEADAGGDAAEAGGGGAGTVGGGERGGAEEGARDGDGDAAVLAGEGDEDGGGDGAEGDGVAPVAAEPDGGLGDGGGAAEAAADEEGPGAVGGDGAASAGA